ncbi:MAG: hypothetical protein MRECE_12c026 [Mycoplasmataceae bacterium CE_OT135]|nr:MAG: hypothetical protein MRECE_12c026 [Mycoplasmataceae bacterium CE_OT135]
MEIIKGQGLSFQCRQCQRENVPLLQISPEHCLTTYCQRCITNAFQEYAEQQWKTKGGKHE